MSYLEVEGLSKSELKSRLTQMGMSLDKLDHPKDFYMQLYLGKYNAKNKVTRDNTPFYKEQVLQGKREREKSYDGQNYDEVEYEEEEEANNYGDDDDEDYVYEESEESNENKFRRRKKKAKTIKFDVKNYDYRESGIKKIRLIRSKKKRILKNRARDGHEGNNIKKNIFVVSYHDEKAGQNNEYYTNNNINNNINVNTQGLNENNDQQYLIENNEYNAYSNNAFPDDTRKMIKLKVEKLYCDGDHYNIRNQYQNEADLSPNNYNRKENQYYGVDSRENYNQNLRSNNNNSANSRNNSANYLSTQYRNSNGNSSLKYNFFIRSITQTVKDDLKKNPMSSKSKNVLVNSDSMNQIEGNNEYNYNNSNNNLRSSPYQDDMDMNNQVEVVVFPRILKGKNKEIQDQKLASNLPKNQIVSDSINKTTIVEQYNNSHSGNSGRRGKDNNYNYDNINEYKKKLRSYSKNKGNNSPEEDNDNDNYINDKITSSNQNYNNVNDNNYEDNNNNNSNINTDFNYKFNNNENMGNNLRSSKNFNNNSNNRDNLNEFNSGNYNNQINMNESNGVYESNPINNNYSGYNNQRNLTEEQRMNYSNNYNNQNDTNNASNINEFNSGSYNNQSNTNATNRIYDSNQNNDNYNNNQNDLNQYGANLDQRIKYNNGGNNSILNSNNMFDGNDMNNYNNNNSNQFSDVVNSNNNMNNNYGNGDYESTLTDDQSRFSSWISGRNSKSNLMDKFKKYIYLFPLILLIVFGIAYFFSKEDDNRTTIIYTFSILMGLLVLYLLFMYIKDKKRYKKMAREDREELLNELQRRNIRIEDLIDNTVFLNNFIERRIQYHKVNPEEYINYVFPYLKKFLKKDRLELCTDKEGNPISYSIEI